MVDNIYRPFLVHVLINKTSKKMVVVLFVHMRSAGGQHIVSPRYRLLSPRAGTERSGEYCQLETFSPRCGRQLDVIVVRSATFGRMRVGRCIDAASLTGHLRDTLGCRADVLDYVGRRCSGRQRCDVAVPDRQLLAARPCSNQLTMYLEASYSCLSGRQSCVGTVGLLLSVYYALALRKGNIER